MLHRLTYLLALSTAALAGCGSNEHCIGDCEPQTTSSDTAEPVTSTEGGTSTTAEATTGETPTTSIPGSTSTAAEDLTTTTGAEGQMTCRDGIACMVQCMIQVPDPPPPDYPLDNCLFTNCLDLMSPAERQELQELRECAEDECGATADWKCIDGTDECMACFLQTLASTNPPPAGECEALAIACQ